MNFVVFGVEKGREEEVVEVADKELHSQLSMNHDCHLATYLLVLNFSSHSYDYDY